MSNLRLAVIGVGHLGKEHARILSGMPEVNLIGVVDHRPEQAEMVAQRCHTKAFTHHVSLLNQIDAAVIAVPTTHHYAVARDCLQHGIPLLIEKPFTLDVDQANSLLALATEKRTMIQVGHIERFNPVFEELQRRPMQPRIITCERLSPYTGRSTDIGVVMDLMIHDLDLVINLVRSPIRSVSAVGVSIMGGHEDLVQANLIFENGCVASLAASRSHDTPVRKMDIWGPEGFAHLDFHQKQLTLAQPEHSDLRHLTNKGGPPTVFNRQTLQCEDPGADQLTRELREFLDAIRQRALPRVTGEQGRNALVLASHILRSIKQHQWTNEENGPCGPHQVPTPLEPLFIPQARSAA